MNILTYAKSNKMTFEEEEINAVDFLILSWVSYYDFASVKDELPLSFENLGKKDLFIKTSKPYQECFEPLKTRALTKALGLSLRYKEAEILLTKAVYNDNGTMFFAAVAIKIDGRIVISYKGTGWSYQGWKEDFMLAYRPEIESHKAAREFFLEVSNITEGDIYLTGHSKGGNLAVNTLFTVDDPSRIKGVYSFDGPGVGALPKSVDASLKERVHKYIPQSSIVGLLFESEFEAKIVKSNMFFVFQHNLFTWEIKNRDLVYLNKRTAYSDNLVDSLKEWIDSLENEDKEKFTFLVFGALEGLKATDFNEFGKTWLFQVAPLLRSYNKLSKEDRKLIDRVIKSLGRHISKPKKKAITNNG